MTRVILDDSSEEGNYFADQRSELEFVHSGCAVLDLVLGGGWPLSRIANVVGDQASGKTLLAIEAMSNFHRQFPSGKMFYRESEAAFDERYAAALGMPVDRVEFVEPDAFVTVEDFYEDLKQCVEVCASRDVPGFYVVDSLDALSSRDELDRKFDEGSYETKKAKQMGKLFRMSTATIAKVRMHVMIVSQTRDKIGISFAGPQKTRSGGRALDFYASQILWLSQREKVSESKDGTKRVVGVQVRAQMKKSKIALPYRECDFIIRFGHGIDSLSSSLDWLEDIKRLDEVVLSSPGYEVAPSRRRYETHVDKMADAAYWTEVKRVDGEVARIWRQIEAKFLENSRAKYR